ncbi:hypothetical protein DFH28DRAFT_1202708, partial [Melampsora americana]
STEDIQHDDPYILSTLFRSSKIDQISSLIQAHQVNQDQRRSLKLMSVIARSQGYLIHKNPTDGQLSLLCSSIATSKLDDPGLILSLSQVLVEKMKSSCLSQEEPLERMIKYLDQLLSLSISSSKGLHGGLVERNRLNDRKSKGITILINFLISTSESRPPFSKIFDILESCPPELLHPNLIKHFIYHHLKLSSSYDSHLRLLQLLKTLSAHLSFNSICPHDLPILLLNQTFTLSNEPHSNSTLRFFEIQNRLKTFLRFLNRFGSNTIRRFRGSRLLRLIYLCLRKGSIELNEVEWKKLENLVEEEQKQSILDFKVCQFKQTTLSFF